MRQVRVARNGYILISIIFYIAGIIYMVLSPLSPLAVCMSSGMILIIYGIVKIIGYFSDDLYCLAFQYDFACGLFLIVMGMIAIGCNLRIWQHLSPCLGLLILLDALLKLQISKDACKFGLKTWNLILAAAIIAGTFGILIIVKPFPGVQVSHMIGGCGLLAEGFMNHLMVKETVKIMKKNIGIDQSNA